MRGAMATQKIMIIDNDANVLEVITAMLERPEYDFLPFTDAHDALQKAKEVGVDLVITDLKMSPMDGLGVLRRIKRDAPQTEVLILTAHATVETAIEAMKEGAFDYLIKPVKMEELKITVSRALSHQRICRENLYLKGQLAGKYGLENIIGKSAGMQGIFDLIHKVAPTDLAVLISGESGTGKELVARAIHYASPRKGYPFVAINCGAIPETLLESELFGHVKGAFTGAIASKVGLFEEAEKGTIFLDEISATSPAVQVTLLRVLQEREFRRVGDSKNLKADVRVLAATNIDLESQVQQQKFREDLYYRISVVNISLPPLRERKEDIPLLVEHFLNKNQGRHSRKKLQEGVLSTLGQYEWPGNVRELENVLERAASLSEGDVIGLSDLPEKIRLLYRPSEPESDTAGEDLREYLRLQEKKHIEKILTESRQDKKRAAQKLGISLPSLYRKLEELHIILSRLNGK